jgi:glycosyltransferase involved in cell wall biosynthesis
MHLSAFHPTERPWRAADKIASLNLDALLLSNHGPLAGAWVRLSSRTPIVAIAHNDDEDSYNEFKGTAANCDAYCAVSKTIFGTLKQLDGKNPSLVLSHIPYGVPLADGPAPAPPKGEARVLAVCRLDQNQKRVLDLPKIWQAYRGRAGQGSLTVCGAGPMEQELTDAFGDELRLGRVRLLGGVPLEQMAAVYSEHDILLSVSGYEGLPISVLEATTHGLFPVLSAIRSGHKEIVEAVDEGRLCAVGNTREFAEALMEAVSDLAALRARREKIRDRARARFGLKGMVESYEKLVREVCARRCGRDGMVRREGRAEERPRVDFVRRLIRKWQYSRHYGWGVWQEN